MSEATDQVSLTSELEDNNLTEEDLMQITGGQVTDTEGALIGGAVSAKVLGVHNGIHAYRLKGGKGGLIAGAIGVAEGAVGGGLTGGIGVHVENTLRHK